MGNVDQVRAKVQSYLAQDFSGVTLEGDGFSLRHGSARAFVRVYEKGENGPVIVQLTVSLLHGVNAGPELYEHIAFHADDYLFGHLSLWRQEDGRLDIFLTHNLLGDYLDQAELGFAVGGLLGSGDDLDDELQARFGGVKFHED